ncbi:MAG: hypothetical protein WKF84_30185 [Pyrinomonadaceae bacterium]
MSMSPALSPVSTNAQALKTRRSPKWHRVYYLLAAFDVLIVLLGMSLNHQIVRIYNRSVLVNQEWVGRRSEYSELGKLAGAVNAPGNNVFDTQDVTGESLKMREALHAFNERMATVEEEMRVEVNEHEPSEATVQSDVERLPEDLAAIKTAMAEMTSEADLIFSRFRQNRPEMAGRHMATMDNKYAIVNTSLAGLREHVGMIQGKIFEEEMAAVELTAELRIPDRRVRVPDGWRGHHLWAQDQKSNGVGRAREGTQSCQRCKDEKSEQAFQTSGRSHPANRLDGQS